MSNLLYPQFLKVLKIIPKHKLSLAVYNQIEQLAYGSHPKQKYFLNIIDYPDEILQILTKCQEAPIIKQPSKKIIKDIMLDNYVICIKDYYKLSNKDAIKILNKLYMYITLKILSYQDFVINENNEIVNINASEAYMQDLVIK